MCWAIRMYQKRDPPLRLHDGRDEFRGRTFGPGLQRCREQERRAADISIHQCPVKLEQCCRLDEHTKLSDPARAYEQCSQP